MNEWRTIKSISVALWKDYTNRSDWFKPSTYYYPSNNLPVLKSFIANKLYHLLLLCSKRISPVFFEYAKCLNVHCVKWHFRRSGYAHHFSLSKTHFPHLCLHSKMKLQWHKPQVDRKLSVLITCFAVCSRMKRWFHNSHTFAALWACSN